MPDTASHILLVDTPPALQRYLRWALGPLGLRLHWPEVGQVVESLDGRRVAAVVLPLASEGGLSERQALRLTREAYSRGVPVLLLTKEVPEAVRVMTAHPVGAADVLASWCWSSTGPWWGSGTGRVWRSW